MWVQYHLNSLKEELSVQKDSMYSKTGVGWYWTPASKLMNGSAKRWCWKGQEGTKNHRITKLKKMSGRLET